MKLTPQQIEFFNREGWLFLLMLFALLLLLTLVPELTLWLPHTMGYRSS